MSRRPSTPSYRRWTDPRHEAFVLENGPVVGWQSAALYNLFVKEFKADFGEEGPPTRSALLDFARRIQGGGHVVVPTSFSDPPDADEIILRVPWKTVLVTGDYQVPHHDEDWVRFAFELGQAWGVEGHVINADLYDFATISVFPQWLPGERVSLGEELKAGKAIIQESMRIHGKVALNTGNHEWRLLVRLLHGELDPDQSREMLAGEGVLFTPLSYLWLGYDAADAVRITHPKSQSVIAGAVGADIARNHDCHVIVAHDHLLCQRRSHSGRWTVTHAGMMAKASRLLYASIADDRRPRMNQGFCIVHPDGETGQPRVRLIDARNTDREMEMWLGRRFAERGQSPAGEKV
jgi:hypothetical protein